MLRGGYSAEREASLLSGAHVEKALLSARHEVIPIDLSEIESLRALDLDCVFIALHGRLGEDGTVQGYLEILGLPYTGSGVLASAACIDKSMTNRLLALAGLRVPEWVEYSGRDERILQRIVVPLGLPVVVKPVTEGSTIGLSIVDDAAAIGPAIDLAQRYDDRVLLQRYVDGVEITVGVLAMPDIIVLPPLEITHASPVYDYAAKYTPGGSAHIIPARISARASDAAVAAARIAFTSLGCDGFARVDMIVVNDEPWVIEVNTIPGLTELSLLPDAARAAGIEFPEFCDRLVRYSASRRLLTKRASRPG